MNNAGKMFQPEYVKAFITYIPVYPKGRNVILSDGNVAVVVENRQYHTLYPVVRRLSDGETIDLAEQNENLSDPLSIFGFLRSKIKNDPLSEPGLFLFEKGEGEGS